METELKPLKIITTEGTDIYFHNNVNDILYQLKNLFLQSKLKMFGTFRVIQINEEDLICKGKLKDMKNILTVLGYEQY